jgi:hypothetical protein
MGIPCFNVCSVDGNTTGRINQRWDDLVASNEEEDEDDDGGVSPNRVGAKAM